MGSPPPRGARNIKMTDMKEVIKWICMITVFVFIAPILFLSPLSRYSENAPFEILLSFILSGLSIYGFIRKNPYLSSIIIFLIMTYKIFLIRYSIYVSTNIMGILYHLACVTLIPITVFFISKRKEARSQ